MSGSDYSSSSSEDTKHRSKKSRVRIKKRVVVKKKKSRHSYTSESSDESPRPRKRSGSKRKRDKGSNIRSSKKRRKREVSVESLSGSAREDDSVSSHGVNFDRHQKGLGKEERVSKKKKVKTEESVLVGENPRRLRSIIVRVTEIEERDVETSRNEDGEAVYVHDDHDYPSDGRTESNDSGNNKREVQEKNNDVTVVSDLRNPKNENSGYVSDNEFEKASSDDIETVLRQKALENLRRFRGAAVTNPKAKNDGDELLRKSAVSATPNVVNESVRKRPVLEEPIVVDELVRKISERPKVIVSTQTQSAKGTNFHSRVEKNTEEVKTDGNESITARFSAAKPKLVRPVFVHKPSETNPAPKEASKEPESLDRADSKIAPTTSPNNDANPPNEPSLGKPEPRETSEASEFEKKTMSVMRGGEMVQVRLILATFCEFCLLCSLFIMFHNIYVHLYFFFCR